METIGLPVRYSDRVDPAGAESRLCRPDGGTEPRLYEKARAVGATRYPIGVLPFTQADWAAQYGDLWSEFAACKQRFDLNILSPVPAFSGSDEPRPPPIFRQPPS